jgi:ferredoxin
VTEKPWLTALLGLGMVAASIATLLVFERKAFCRYACLVGRVSGLYALFSATELRARERELCRRCTTRDCFRGNTHGEPCPTHQFLGAMETNAYCTLCFECVKSCPAGNVAWNVRPPGADLLESPRRRVDEAYLAVIMLALSAFHGLTMTPAWDAIVAALEGPSGGSRLAGFSLGMALVLAAPLGVYYGLCRSMKWLAGDRENSTRLLFIRFSYSLLPIALFYHLAHNLQHIFYEGKKLLRVASDPFGWGWDLFGTAALPIDAVLPVDVGWALQVALVVVGHLFGILIAHRAAVALYAHTRRATLSQLPVLAAMVLFSFQSLWLLAQPMAMRTAM